MSELTPDTAQSTPVSTGLLYSSSIHRKINRNFFRNDVALKSYKCNLLATNLTTAAKIYISNLAIYVVHRPKRRKLTTIPFTVVTEIAHREDTGSVEIHTANSTVYTLTNFQRPEPAIAFLVNFWKLIRKGKVIPREGAPSGALFIEHSRPTERCFHPPSATSRPRLLDSLTTVSLNNSANVSETESVVTRKTSSIAMMFPSAVVAEPSHEQMNKAAPNMVHSCPSASSLEDKLTTPVCKPVQPPPDNLCRTTPAVLASLNVNPECVTTQRSSIVPPLLKETTFHLPSHNTKEPNLLSACHPSSGNRTLFVAGSTPGHKPSICLTESSNWSIWPLSFLPYPFSPSPQRFTIIIAYAILAFLLFSTLHLYHRVTLFNPNMDSTIDLPEQSPHASFTSNDPRDHIDALELRLSQLVELTSTLAKSLAQLANELNWLQQEAKSGTTSYEDTSVK